MKEYRRNGARPKLAIANMYASQAHTKRKCIHKCYTSTQKKALVFKTRIKKCFFFSTEVRKGLHYAVLFLSLVSVYGHHIVSLGKFLSFIMVSNLEKQTQVS